MDEHGEPRFLPLYKSCNINRTPPHLLLSYRNISVVRSPYNIPLSPCYCCCCCCVVLSHSIQHPSVYKYCLNMLLKPIFWINTLYWVQHIWAAQVPTLLCILSEHILRAQFRDSITYTVVTNTANVCKKKPQLM